jgi:hypothetical protein
MQEAAEAVVARSCNLGLDLLVAPFDTMVVGGSVDRMNVDTVVFVDKDSYVEPAGRTERLLSKDQESLLREFYY